MTEEYKREYKDYSNHIAIMISYDRLVFNERSAVHARMKEYSKLYKELHIIIFSTNKFEQIDISENCKAYSTNSFSRFNYVFEAFKIGKRIIKKTAEDQLVLITCQDPFETALVGKRLVKFRKNSELLLQIHTDLFSSYFTDNRIGIQNAFLNKIRLFISKFTLPQADTIRVVSKKIADSLVKKGINSEKIIIKPIDVNVDRIRNSQPTFNLKERFPQFKKIILMVSRLEAEKNIEMAIGAMKIVKAKNTAQKPQIGLIIVGSGRLSQKLKKMAYNLDLEHKIAFVGWQSDLVSYYKGCDIFLVTSWYEGYGMVFKEAEATGCKIISTDVGIAREVGAEIVGWNAQEIGEKLVNFLK